MKKREKMQIAIPVSDNTGDPIEIIYSNGNNGCFSLHAFSCSWLIFMKIFKIQFTSK